MNGKHRSQWEKQAIEIQIDQCGIKSNGANFFFNKNMQKTKMKKAHTKHALVELLTEHRAHGSKQFGRIGTIVQTRARGGERRKARRRTARIVENSQGAFSTVDPPKT
jgi:hypothetical protein